MFSVDSFTCHAASAMRLIPESVNSIFTPSVAIEQVQKMFPDREVVGVQTKEVAFGGGNIHCITQQQPAVKK